MSFGMFCATIRRGSSLNGGIGTKMMTIENGVLSRYSSRAMTG
ncbi:hypothetical protein ACQPTN_40600 [Bradyrhizobium sp. 13971]